MSSPTHLRPLGKYEIFSSSRHDLGFYRCIINTCRYIRPASSSATISATVEAALARVVLDLPALRIAIADESTPAPSFVAVPSLNLRDHVEHLALPRDDDPSDPSLMRVIERQHALLFPEISTRPPWKLLVVTREPTTLDIAFAAHHSITDGGGTSRFHTRLLSALNSPSSSLMPSLSPLGILTASGPPNLAPPQESLVNLSVSWPFLLRVIAADLVPSWLRRSTPPWTGGLVTPDPHTAHLRLLTIPPSTAAALLAACRAHNTTLTPLLHVLFLSALVTQLPSTSQSFVSSTPISLRPYLTQPVPDSVDLDTLTVPMVTSYSHHFVPDTVSTLLPAPFSDASIWSLAADVKAGLAQKQASLPHDDVSGMLPYAGDWHARWRARVGQPRADSWELSNLGRMAPSAPGEWTIERAVFSQGPNVGGPALTLNVVGTTDGAVGATIGWQEGVVDDGVADGAVRELGAALERFAKDGRFGVYV